MSHGRVMLCPPRSVRILCVCMTVVFSTNLRRSLSDSPGRAQMSAERHRHKPTTHARPRHLALVPHTVVRPRHDGASRARPLALCPPGGAACSGLGEAAERGMGCPGGDAPQARGPPRRAGPVPLRGVGAVDGQRGRGARRPRLRARGRAGHGRGGAGAQESSVPSSGLVRLASGVWPSRRAGVTRRGGRTRAESHAAARRAAGRLAARRVGAAAPARARRDPGAEAGAARDRRPKRRRVLRPGRPGLVHRRRRGQWHRRDGHDRPRGRRRRASLARTRRAVRPPCRGSGDPGGGVRPAGAGGGVPARGREFSRPARALPAPLAGAARPGLAGGGVRRARRSGRR